MPSFLSNPSLGPAVALVTAFLSAVMDLLTAFHAFNFDANERTAVLTVASTGILLGLFLFSILHVSVQNVKATNAAPTLVALTSPLPAPFVAPTPPMPAVSPAVPVPPTIPAVPPSA